MLFSLVLTLILVMVLALISLPGTDMDALVYSTDTFSCLRRTSSISVQTTLDYGQLANSGNVVGANIGN